MFRIGQYIVGSTGQAKRAAHAAHAENRRALYIRPQPHQIYQPRIERRARDASDGNHEQRVEVPAPEAGAFERAVDCARAQVLRNRQPRGVGFAPGAEPCVSLEWKRQVAILDPHARMQAVQ